MSQPPPPPRRTTAPTPPSSSSSSQHPKSGWKAKASAWGKVAVVKGTILSDRVGVKVNKMSANMGSESFWPVTGDFPAEMDKAALDAPEETVEVEPVKGYKKQQKVVKRIPQKIIRDAKGLAIFTSMRTGMAPFGGAGGAGLVVAKLPDGSWSAPSSMSPNNLSGGLMLGIDIYDAVLIIRTQAALDSFSGHKVTLGAEFGVAAGPYGTGAALEGGIDKSPVLSYIRSRGAYAGVEAVGQIFVIRKEENELQYSWPGVTSGDILQGKVRVPREAALLMQALSDAEGRRDPSPEAGPSYSPSSAPILPPRPTFDHPPRPTSDHPPPPPSSEYPPEKTERYEPQPAYHHQSEEAEAGPTHPRRSPTSPPAIEEKTAQELATERYERETAEADARVEEVAVQEKAGPPAIPPRVDSGVSLSRLNLHESGTEPQARAEDVAQRKENEAGPPSVIPPRVDSGVSLEELNLHGGEVEGSHAEEEEVPVGVQLPAYSVEESGEALEEGVVPGAFRM